MTLSCRIVNVKPKVKMKNEDVDVLWVCVCVANFLIFSYLGSYKKKIITHAFSIMCVLLGTMAIYFWCDNFENDEFESDQFF